MGIFYTMSIIQASKKKAILKKGKDKAIRNRHHWIFSGAIDTISDYEDGEFLPVFGSAGELLGTAYFNHKSSIAGRMVSFDSTDPLQAIERNISNAIEMRQNFFNPIHTNGYRLINGEGDCLPGLIVDKYHDVLVFQLSTKGMDKLRPWLVETFAKKLNPRCIYEKSLLPSRKEEGLHETEGVLYGEDVESVEILENGLKFKVGLKESQKTGFFLDHREMRKLIGTLSKDKKVLNCFSYTGGFSVYALNGGARVVDSVDISEASMQLAEHNVGLNGFSRHDNGFFVDDVFNFLRENPLDYDIIILDPPAFAKKRKDVVAACRGYKDINRVALQKMPAKSLLLSCSCSYFVDEALFQKVVFQASIEAKRTVKIIQRHHLAIDHPINICHPEGDYLKSLLLYVD